MQKLIIILFSIMWGGLLCAQTNYPTNYFHSPLEIPLVLSGTFGELRSNHFHAGLDIKTQSIEGLNVKSSAEGYVSRIRISHWSYGKVIYITHPNGYTTVYGHLKKFAPKIEQYVKKHQYNKESYTIHLFPKPDELRVNQDELIAYSGNTGSSSGPHLHYEIRDTKANIINPMLFGIKIKDHIKPTIRKAFTYTKNDTSYVNQSNKDVELIFKRQKNGDLLANKIYAYGTIGIGINAIDRLDGANNHNGLYALKMDVNGQNIFDMKFDKFSFSETRLINSFIDYKRYARLNQKIQKCFVSHPANNLSLYKNLKNKGFFTVRDSLDYQVTVTAKDFEGNTTKLIIPIRGKKDSIVVANNTIKTPHFFLYNKPNSLQGNWGKVTFPKNAFYEDFYFDYSYTKGVLKLHNRTVPLAKKFHLIFDTSNYTPEEQKKLYIAKKSKRNKWNYAGKNYHKKNEISIYSNNLGEYTLLFDNEKPDISPFFKKDQWLTKGKTLKIKIYDRKSGIKSYRGEIDGKWILMEYNPKKNRLTYNFSDKKFEGVKHILKVVVKDNVNNTTTFTTSFNKKLN